MLFTVQPMLVVASDARMQRGEVAAIVQVVDAGQSWLEGQTGHRLRVADRVVIVRAPWRSSAMHYPSVAAVNRIEAAIPAPAGTVNLIFYEGTDTFMGGRATWWPGHTALIFTGGTSLTGWWFQRFWITAFHELFHSFGLVPVNAPHSDGTGHVTDDRCDVMAPTVDSTCTAPTLDVDRADYWSGLIASPFLV